MPTYEYECKACGHKFEEFQSITSEPLKKCPSCAKRKLQRLFGTGAGIIFKGSGFYATDYRSDADNKAAASDKSAASGEKPAAGEKGSGEKTTSEKPAASTASDAKPAAPSKSEDKPKAATRK